jgi:hypothetical protein
MSLKNYRPLFNLVFLAGVVYLIHKLIFYFFRINQELFFYSIETLYLLFLAFSFVVFLILLKVKERSFDNVGMSFLLTTSLKMILCYLVLKPILKISSHDTTTEKVNFFVMFVLFLTMETVLTIRILNEKQ